MIGRDLKRGIKILAGEAGELAGKIAKETDRIGLKIRLENIEMEIKASYRDLGMVAFEKITNGEGDLREHEEIKNIMQRIHEVSLKKARIKASEQSEHEGEAPSGFAGGGGDASPLNKEEQ